MNPQLVNFGLPTTGQFSAAVDILSATNRNFAAVLNQSKPPAA
jgi:hypothetical protein